MILRKGEELDIKLKEIFTAEDSELKHLQKQNNYFRDGWVKLQEVTFLPPGGKSPRSKPTMINTPSASTYA